MSVTLHPLVAMVMMTVALMACSRGSESRSLFWDTTDDVRGGSAFMTYEIRDLPGLLKVFDAAFVVRVSAIEEVKREGPWTSPVSAEDPADQATLDWHMRISANLPVQTRYSGEVLKWLQGSGPEKISLVIAGGLADIEQPDGAISRDQPIFPDGMFLLEPGRTYLLLADKTDSGEYEYGRVREAFDLTGGVHVLNHPLTRDIEHYEDMSVDDFIAYVKGLADANSVADN